MREVCGNCGRVARHETEDDDEAEREQLGRGEHVLDERTEPDAHAVERGEGDDQHDGNQVRGGKAEVHVAQDHGPKVHRRDVTAVPQPCACRDGRKEHTQKLAEGDRNGGNGAGLDDEKERPAVEEAPHRAEALAQVHVLAAGLGHHGGEFAVTQRTDDGHDGGDRPGCDEERRRVDDARHVRRDDKDAGADHGAGHDCGGGEQTEALDELRGFPVRCRWVCFCRGKHV